MTEIDKDKRIEELESIINDQVYRISELEYTTGLIDVIMKRMNPVLERRGKMSYPELGREMYFLCSAIKGFREHIGD